MSSFDLQIIRSSEYLAKLTASKTTSEAAMKEYTTYKDTYDAIGSDDTEFQPLFKMRQSLVYRAQLVGFLLAETDEIARAKVLAEFTPSITEMHLNITDVSRLIPYNTLQAQLAQEPFNCDAFDASLQLIDQVRSHMKQCLSWCTLQHKRRTAKLKKSTSAALALAAQKEKLDGAKSTAAATQRLPRPPPSVSSKLVPSLFQRGPLKVDEPPMDGEVNGSLPFKVAAIFEPVASDQFTAFATSFLSNFPTAAQYKLDGRCQQTKLPTHVVQAFKPHMFAASGFADVSAGIKAGDAKLDVYQSFSAFAVDNVKHPTPRVEYEGGGQLRYELGGGSEVLAVRYSALRAAWMASTGHGATFKESSLSSFMQHMPDEVMASLNAQHDIYKMSRARHTLTYVPSGWFVAEGPRGVMPSWGFRLSAVSSTSLGDLRIYQSDFPKPAIAALIKWADENIK